MENLINSKEEFSKKEILTICKNNPKLTEIINKIYNTRDDVSTFRIDTKWDIEVEENTTFATQDEIIEDNDGWILEDLEDAFSKEFSLNERYNWELNNITPKHCIIITDYTDYVQIGIYNKDNMEDGYAISTVIDLFTNEENY